METQTHTNTMQNMVLTIPDYVTPMDIPKVYNYFEYYNIAEIKNVLYFDHPEEEYYCEDKPFYGFMIIEIIAQAFRQINDAQYRGNKSRKTTPRSLRNVIITLPTATPKQEQAIIKSKVRGAIKLLWGRMARKA